MRSWNIFCVVPSLQRCVPWRFGHPEEPTHLVHMMFCSLVLLLHIANYLRVVQTVHIEKGAFLPLAPFNRGRANRVGMYASNNHSCMGSESIFNKICNDTEKKNGDKASELLQRANYIKDVNGLYNLLPLGYKSIEKLIHFLNIHLKRVNSHGLFMSILQAKKWWNISDRSKLYSDEFLYVYKQKQQKGDMSKVNETVMTKKKMEDDGLILSPTCEEQAICLINQVYNENIPAKSLPLLIHQFNYKFRNEKRLEKTLFKSKEFLMKDGYSFHSNDICLNETYDSYKECYGKIFSDLKLPFKVTKKRKMDKMNALESHEFQVLCRDGKYKEAAHIFKLGDYYSKKLGIKYLNKRNEKNNILMGSYGIGIYRLLYFLVDSFYDDDGIRLPEQIAPFSVYLIQTNQRSKYSATKVAKIVKMAQVTDAVEAMDAPNMATPPLNSNDVEYVLTLWLYNTFKNSNVDIYYDDTDLHLSRKLKNCDLIGVPNRIIINLNSEQRKIKIPPDFYNYMDTRNAILSNKLYMTFRDVTVEYKSRFSPEKKIMTIHQLFRQFGLI
ncbi:proline--tRNA ligase, putative [Plasmodium knowlesi strain H]|uniref:Proline--tRNA ligase, putative n=3 Tax=Plasmodium knowlesi TaxID=5850 RepID=A0A5K1U2M1_PLAKH|nr:proline--tRNA ligase, putative [Plasmodium knowlesi strain H]OTN67326.1 putative Proline--tRNA ligase [Plasmodium knowlesi]CAA9987522.1 proline--tRNA ligase, putative [Plasmodium knowlesi strain H]SBO23131.1 proline--tRNA ligase, putative [Plasmodium knowlesi strain H]SBO23779.1 proline--tRNA ligase, putative [Plasmodium knowlesi strain H]VVS76996.1 proline--tRNA ligase, putative [Plasmodium knowlesi strain H]|eukprot:XP_002258523.1 prolyl-t-rna synthase, putative [Plasmodium knowlesi strain H]